MIELLQQLLGLGAAGAAPMPPPIPTLGEVGDPTSMPPMLAANAPMVPPLGASLSGPQIGFPLTGQPGDPTSVPQPFIAPPAAPPPSPSVDEMYPGGRPPQTASLGPQPSASATPGRGGLANALRGVQAPQAPTPPRVSTPAAPRVSDNVKGGELLALLQLLNSQGAASQKLPTLGQTLGR